MPDVAQRPSIVLDVYCFALKRQLFKLTVVLRNVGVKCAFKMG